MKNSNKGFTLIEVLVAMGIIMLIAMAFFSINNMSIKVNAKNEKDIQSMNIAQSVMEDIRQDIKTKTTIDVNGRIESGIKKEDISTDKTNKTKIEIENIEQSNNKYNVAVNIFKEENQNNKDLYTVEIDVSAANSTNKHTKLITQIFEK